ncbi:unnamed protein product [Rhizoctonia solani]|uniref:Fe2OG dioxygenase domain-containing protein n=1 Tax=Rhizoctonia solani TaxID=456999 RepID=A0A8H3C1H9_9AGAM|nr:unnamed protein product [Rhizoctonia solani]
MPLWQSKKRPEYLFGDRLTPPPDRNRTYVRDTPLTNRQKDGFTQENFRRLRVAITNTVVLPPGYDYSAEQVRTEASHKRPKGAQPSRRGGVTIEVDNSCDHVIRDDHGNVIAIYFPRYVRGESLTNLNHRSLAYGQHACRPFMTAEGNAIRALEQHTTKARLRRIQQTIIAHIKSRLRALGKKGPPGEKFRLISKLERVKNPSPKANWANRWIKGCDGDRYRPIGVFGMVHTAFLWHAIGHQYADAALPSTDAVLSKTVEGLCIQYQFMDGMEALDFRINNLVEIAFPELSQLMQKLRPEAEQNPLMYSLSRVWHSDFHGRAVLFNKKSAEHIDTSGVHRGWDILVAGGDFEGGGLFFKDLNMRIPFGPGDIIAFDGTAQRHAIEPFTGPQRISHVYFIHDSVFREHGIVPSLPDIHINQLAQRIPQLASKWCPITMTELKGESPAT